MREVAAYEAGPMVIVNRPLLGTQGVDGQQGPGTLIAKHAALDKFHLVRAFRSAVGLPPYEYLTYLRVSRARELLRGGALVAEVAQAVGFYDESQLHRHFRRIVGVPPGVYARSFVSSERRGQHHPRRAAARDASSPHERTRSQ